MDVSSITSLTTSPVSTFLCFFTSYIKEDGLGFACGFVNHSTYARLSCESWSGNLSLGDLKQTWGSPFYISMSTANSMSSLFHKTMQHKTLSHHQVTDGHPRWPHGGVEWQCTGQFAVGVLMIWCLSLESVVMSFQCCGCRRQSWTPIGWWDTRRRCTWKLGTSPLMIFLQTVGISFLGMSVLKCAP
jgi:hypothetical protein